MAYRGSRLKRLEERRALKSTGFYIVLTIGLVVIIVVFGLPAVTKLAAFVADIAGKQTVQNTDTKPPPPPPTINGLPNHTKEEKLRLTGFTRPGYTAVIFFNNDKTEVLANADGEFTTILFLSLGENKMYAKVEDSAGKESASTHTYTIVLDKEPPKIEIISPENGKQFIGSFQNQIEMEGQTEVGSEITINGRVVIVKSDGKFNYQTTLAEGENIFKIKSKDKAGNETELEHKVTFVK